MEKDLAELSAEGYAEIHVKLSVISVITMTGTFHWVSAVTQRVLVTLLPFQAPSLWTQVTNSGNCFPDVDPPQRSGFLPQTFQQLLRLQLGILCNTASKKANIYISKYHQSITVIQVFSLVNC